MKRKISILMALVLMMSTILSFTVSAASEVYVAKSQINVYKNTACTTRGTCKPSKAYNAYMSRYDDVNVQKLTSTYAKVDYPTSSGRRTGYITRSDYNNKLKKYSSRKSAFLADPRFKVGVSWGGGKTPQYATNKSHWGCNAYAWDYAAYVYQKNVTAGTKFTKASDIRSGDIIYVTPTHWMIVLSRSGDTLDILHANWTGGKVCRGKYTLDGKKIGTSGKTFSYGYHY